MSKRAHKAELKELFKELKELNLPQVEMDSRVHSFIERAGGLDKYMPLDEAIDALDGLCGQDPPSKKASRDSYVRTMAIKAHLKGKLAMKEVGGILGVEVGSFLRWAQMGFQKLINSNFLFQELRRPERPKDQEWISVKGGLDRFMDKFPQLLDPDVARSRLQKAYVRGKIVSAGKGRNRVLQVKSLDAWIQGQIAKLQDGRDAKIKAERKPKF